MLILSPLISAPVFLITPFLMEFLMGFFLPICYTQAEHMQLYTHIKVGLFLPSSTAAVRRQLGCWVAPGSCTLGNVRLIISAHIATGQVKSGMGLSDGEQPNQWAIRDNTVGLWR